MRADEGFVEDRLLLRGWIAGDTEVQFLLTRPMIRELLEGIEDMASKLISGRLPDPTQKQAVADFARDTAIERGNFEQAYRAGKPHSLMKHGPRLVMSLAVVPDRSTRITMTFGLDKEEEIKLAIPAQGLWTLAHILREQVQRAEWDQPIARPSAASTELNQRRPRTAYRALRPR